MGLRHLGTIVLVAALGVVGCNSGPGGDKFTYTGPDGKRHVWTRVHCERAIKFQAGGGGKISGIEIPFKALGGSIKIGEAEINPTLLRQASDFIQALDIVSTNACTDLLDEPDGNIREAIRKRRDSATTELFTLATRLNAAQTEADYKAAVDDATARANKEIGPALQQQIQAIQLLKAPVPAN